MSLIFAEGFDWIESSLTGDALTNELPTWGGSDLQVSGTPGSLIAGRLGGNAIGMGSLANHRLITPLINTTGATDGIIGFAFLTPPAFFADVIFQLRGANTTANSFSAFQITIGASGVLSFDPHNFSSPEVAIGSLNPNQWYYLEIKFDMGTTNFSAQPVVVHLDGVEAINTNLNIGDDDGWTGFQLNGANFAFDDIYVCSTSGPVNNDILGPITIRALLPDADGGVTDFSGSAPGNHFELVDELGSDGDTTFVESTAPGQTELYSHVPSAPTGNVIGVVQTVTMRATDATPVNVQFTTRTGGTNSNHSNLTVGTQNFLAYHETYDLNPANSAAWTEAALDATEFGITRN